MRTYIMGKNYMKVGITNMKIKEYLEKVNIKTDKIPKNIEELLEITERNNIWSFCVDDYSEIKNKVVLVEDNNNNKRYFELEKTEIL